MSVSFAKAVVAHLRGWGFTVIEVDGCYMRGNGQTSAYIGSVTHHTAGGNNVKLDQILISGRSDLSGPLCNTAVGYDGTIYLVAAHPANHAGASGGWDTAPLPVTGMFNRLTWGTEAMYNGVSPMPDAQYDSAAAIAAAVSRVTGNDLRHAKLHQGTSIQGKFDIGYAPGKTYDVVKFREHAQKYLDGTGSDGPTWDAILTYLTGA